MTARPTRDMSSRHEATLAEELEGRSTRNSGATWHDKGDGKHDRRLDHWAFCWDGKATMAASISVKLSDWVKLEEQADFHSPAMPIRFYRNARLTQWLDLVLVRLDNFAEMRSDAARYRAIREQGCLVGMHLDGDPADRSTCTVCGSSTYDRAENLDA